MICSEIFKMDEESELAPSGISFLKKQSVDITFTDITFEVRTFKPWRRPFISKYHDIPFYAYYVTFVAHEDENT